MAGRRRAVLTVVVVVAALIGAVALIVPALVDVDRYRPQAVAYLEQKTGKPVKIGRLALTIFPTPSIRADDFEIDNPAGFPGAPFVKARRIYAAVDAKALWNRQVLVQSLELDDPVISLISDARGHWNFESPAAAPAEASQPSSGAPSFTLGVISKLTMSGGQLTVANLSPPGRTAVPYFQVRGTSCTLEQFDLQGFTTAGAASAGQGSLQADLLRFGNVETTKVRSKLRLASKQVFFDNLSLDADGGQATGNLALNFAGAETRFDASARLRGVDAARMLAAFPSGRGKLTGALEGNVKLDGETTHSEQPLAGMQGAGQLTVRNGQLPSLKLNRNLMTLARLGSLGPAAGDPSSFSQLAADFTLADQRISSSKITITGNGVDAQGSGVLSLPGAGSLDYQGLANIAAQQNALTNILVGLSGATYANGKLSFPFRVSGTLDDPKFSLAGKGGINTLSNLAGGAASAGPNSQKPANLVDSLGKLLQKKK